MACIPFLRKEFKLRIGELESENYEAVSKVIDNVGDFVHQIDALNYLRHLSINSNVNIENWDLHELFGCTENKNLLITDRGEINKRFFAVPTEVVEGQAVGAFDATMLENAEARVYGINIKRARQELKERKDSMRVGYRNYLRNLRQYRELFKQVHGKPLEIEKSFIQQVQDIVAEGFFKLVDCNGQHIRFITQNPVIVCHDSYTVNFGKLEVVIDCDGEVPRGEYNETNLRLVPDFSDTDIYMHPHFMNREICFGEHTDDASQYVLDGELVKLMSLIQRLMLHVDEENPYFYMSTFYDFSHGLGRYHPYCIEYRDKFNGCNPAGYGRDGKYYWSDKNRKDLVLNPKQKEHLDFLINKFGKEVVLDGKTEEITWKCDECGERYYAQEPPEECNECGCTEFTRLGSSEDEESESIPDTPEELPDYLGDDPGF